MGLMLLYRRRVDYEKEPLCPVALDWCGIRSREGKKPVQMGKSRKIEQHLMLRLYPSKKGTSEKTAFLWLIWADLHSWAIALRAIAFLER